MTSPPHPASPDPAFPAPAPPVLSPLDGRYRSVVAPLADQLSERALNATRVEVECAWLAFLHDESIAGLTPLDAAQRAALDAVATGVDDAAVAELAAIEATTRHDVKAVEYWIKRRLADTPLADSAEMVHFLCTSEDVNNLAYALMLRRAVTQVWLPAAHGVADDLHAMALEHADVAMLARTHGQPATPTTLGKELAVVVARLRRQLARVEATQYLGKLNGATGTYAAHTVACPEVDWPAASRRFVTSLGLAWNPLTTQIEPHDWMAELFADVARFGRVVHDLCVDVWLYVSAGWFRQAVEPGAVGSSTMPHKVNPIRFENAEANLEVSAGMLHTLESTLVTSRLQRDLSDSSMLRTTGPALGHSLLALVNVRRGLASLAVAHDVIAADLDGAWEVLAEAVQSVLRRAGVDRPYERLAELTRGGRVDAARLHAFVRDQGLPAALEQRLLALTPATYTGLAGRLARGEAGSAAGAGQPRAEDPGA